MRENLPLVSIVIGTFNQAEYLPYTLDSIKNQTYQNWECIIVDDGSVDNTKEVLQQYVAKDSRFKYFYKSNEGVAIARNFGLNKAQGIYLQILDSDDYLSHNRFEECVKVMEENEELEMLVTNFKMFTTKVEDSNPPFSDLNNYDINFNSVLTQWDRGLGFPPHAVFLRRKAVDEVRFNEETRFKEDWLYWLSVLQQVKCTKFIDKTLAHYRVNPNGKHKKSNANFVNISLLVYDGLNESNKKKFFSRMVEEVIEVKSRLVDCAQAYDYKDSELLKKEKEIKRLKMSIFKKVYLKITGKYKAYKS